MANWFQRLAQAINIEYDRRIRRASQVTEYGAQILPAIERRARTRLPSSTDRTSIGPGPIGAASRRALIEAIVIEEFAVRVWEEMDFVREAAERLEKNLLGGQPLRRRPGYLDVPPLVLDTAVAREAPARDAG